MADLNSKDFQQDVVMPLMIENMMLRAQFHGLKMIVAALALTPGERIPIEMLDQVYLSSVQDAAQIERASHPALEPYWRAELDRLLSEVSGVFLPNQK